MSLIAMAVHDLQGSGRTELTEKTIDSLFETVDFKKHRLFIIDNGSCEETQRVLEAAMWQYNLNGWPGENFTLIKNSENIGTARAINKAWKHRKPGEHAIKMDNDVVIHQSGWVEAMEEAIERQPKLGQVGLKRKDCWEYPTHPDAGLRSQLIMLPHVPGEKWLVVEAVNHVIGTCVMHSSALLDKVGFMYQPTLYGWDDVLMSQRSHLAGFWNAFLPHIHIDHIDPGGTDYQKWKEGDARQGMDELDKIQKAYIDGTRPIYEPCV